MGSFFSRAQGENRRITPESRYWIMTQRGDIGQKIKAYHSYRNQKYNLHSRSDDCTWGVTGSKRPCRVRSFIGLTN